MVHGYHARWVASTTAKQPLLGRRVRLEPPRETRGWNLTTRPRPRGDLRTASSAFDFTTQFTLKDNKGDISSGMASKRPWHHGRHDGRSAVEAACRDISREPRHGLSHERGWHAAGAPRSDSFQNNWEVEQAYAYILTHPGLPSVYWKHYSTGKRAAEQDPGAHQRPKGRRAFTSAACCVSRTTAARKGFMPRW